ncbi:DUF6343 family protein [Actinocorallia aurantiaca]|uniref:DUF3040 family protein n=1 Tax=Actinocorallia aurantiaca TaxID=46204 RepID=A0ABP6GNE6_9ACTN
MPWKRLHGTELDPRTAGGHLPPARSALTLRLALAAFGLLAGLVGVAVVLMADVPWGFAVLFGLIALTALVDLVVVAGRKHRGEPG